MQKESRYLLCSAKQRIGKYNAVIILLRIDAKCFYQAVILTCCFSFISKSASPLINFIGFGFLSNRMQPSTRFSNGLPV